MKSGRPRDESAKDAILTAAFSILGERNYAGFTIEAVASAAGVAKTTIYRWWPSKAELAVEAFFFATKSELAFPNTGSAQSDFRIQITELSNLLRGPRGSAMASMLGGSRMDEKLAIALGEKWLMPRRKWGFERMTKAKVSGELQDNVDIGAALALLYGPIYTPLLFGQNVPDVQQLEAILTLACKAIFHDDVE
jgi:AcrR family transcriptional regulator